MEKIKFKRNRNKKITNTTSVTERLEKIRSQNNQKPAENICSTFPPENANENGIDEYPKLRRPKPATLLKIQKHEKKSDDLMVFKDTEDVNSIKVPLRQEFIIKRRQFEQAASDLLKKYEHKNQKHFLDSGDESINKEANPGKSILTKSLNYCEQHLVNIFITKVKAHPNGFFAENLPHWYKKTFEKNLPLNWLDLLRASNKFDIEIIQNKVVLYTKPTNELDVKAAGDKIQESKEISKLEKMESDSFVGFVRYKHLQKSIRNYN